MKNSKHSFFKKNVIFLVRTFVMGILTVIPFLMAVSLFYLSLKEGRLSLRIYALLSLFLSIGLIHAYVLTFRWK